MLFNVSTLDSNDDSELLKRMVHHAEEIDIFKKQIEAQSNTIRDLQDDISKSERERESFLQFNAQLQDENTRLKDEKTSPKEKTQGIVPDATPQSSSNESTNEKKKSSRLGIRHLGSLILNSLTVSIALIDGTLANDIENSIMDPKNWIDIILMNPKNWTKK